MGRGPSRHHYSAPVTGLFTLTQPVILLHTVSLLWSLVLKVICYGSFPVTVRIALLFHFLKRPKKLGQVFHFLSLFCFPSISNILSPPPHSLPALLLVCQPPSAGPRPLSAWKASGLTGKAEPGRGIL